MYLHNKYTEPNNSFKCYYIVVKATWYKVGPHIAKQTAKYHNKHKNIQHKYWVE